MNKHTAGPWRAYGRQVWAADGRGGHSRFVAGCSTDTLDKDELEVEEANAQLIATALELLAALENLENDDGAIPQHAWNLVQAAIAKAKGEA